MATRALIWLLFASVAYGQSTSITATITDPDAQTWNNGSWSAVLMSSGPPFISGVPVTATTASGVMSSIGVLTGTLADNSRISPAGSSWRFTICPNATASCSVVSTAVAGASQDLSSVLSAGISAPRFAAAFGAFGYLDGEVSPAPPAGATYWNVTSLVTRVWTGSAWTTISGGGGGTGTVTTFGTSGYPSYLGTTSVSNPTTTPSLVFTPNAAAAQNSFLAGPTSGAGALSLRAIVPGDVPTLNQNTTGSAGSAGSLSGTPTLCSVGNAPVGILANGNATGCAPLGGSGGLPTATAAGQAPVSTAAGTTYTAQGVVLTTPTATQKIAQPLGTSFSAQSENVRIQVWAAPTTCSGAPYGTHSTQFDCAQGYAAAQANATGNSVALDIGAGVYQTCDGMREPTGGFWKISYFGAGPGVTTVQASALGGCAVAGAPLFNNAAGFGRFEVDGINFDANNIASTCHDGTAIQSVIERDTDCHNPNIGLGSFVCTSDGTTGNLTGCSGTFPAVGNFVQPRFMRPNPPLTVTAVNAGAGTITVALPSPFGINYGVLPPALVGGMYNFTTVDHVEGWGNVGSFSEDSHIYDAVVSGPYTTNVTFATLIVGFSSPSVTGLTCSACGNYGSGLTDMVIGFNDPTHVCTTLPVAHVATMTGTAIATMVIDYGGNCTSAPFAWAAPSLQVPYTYKYYLSDSTIDTVYAGAGKIGMFELGGNTLVTHFHPTQTEVGFEGHGNVHYDSTECDTIYQLCAMFWGTSQDVITYNNAVTATHILPGMGSFYFANTSSPVQFSSMGNMFTNSNPTGYNLFLNPSGIVIPCGAGWPATASVLQVDHIKAGAAVPTQAVDCIPALSTGKLTVTGTGIPISSGTTANNDLDGRLTLASGTVARSFTSTYTTAPVCVATDTTALNPVKASTTTTALTLTGTGTDVIAYICIGIQ